jgi:hypothetical protein
MYAMWAVLFTKLLYYRGSDRIFFARFFWVVTPCGLVGRYLFFWVVTPRGLAGGYLFFFFGCDALWTGR